MFDPQGLYSRRTYDSRKGQIVQKKGSKPNKEIDLNSIPRIVEFLRKNGYYISDHVPRCPVYIDRYVNVELKDTNVYSYINSPIDNVDDESLYFNTQSIIRSSLDEIHNQYVALLQQVDDLLDPQLTFLVKSLAFSFYNAQTGGVNNIALTGSMRFGNMNSSIVFTDVIQPNGSDNVNSYGTISRYSGNTFQFVDIQGNFMQFATSDANSLALYSTDNEQIVYNYIDQKIPPNWQFGSILYDITNVDRQVNFRIFIYIEAIVSFRCKIEPKTEE